MRDIENRADIDLLMREFYARAVKDEVIGYIFTDVAKLDLDHHLPIIGDFWETLLFRTGDYGRHGRNPLQVHAELAMKTPLRFEHFERWLAIFESCVDDRFAGEAAGFARLRARSVANRMLEHVSGFDLPPVNAQHTAEAARDRL